jgi:hypothetical protein
MRMASPFVVLFRELQEMRYLWRTPLQLDNRRLLAVLGQEPHTPLDEAVACALAQLGCLGQADRPTRERRRRARSVSIHPPRRRRDRRPSPGT